MSEWKPIETAPKNGTRILLGRFKSDCPMNGRCAVDWWSLPEDGRGWIGFGKFNPTYWPPTHWMPLPPPPESNT
jgi:hypothetical protein